MYLPNGVVSEKELVFSDAASAKAHPLAQELFKIPGIVRVTLDVDNVKVEKAGTTDWKEVKVEITSCLYGYFEAN